jgi:predicted Ser/Thr protein kinase
MDSIGRYQILGELGRGAMGVVYRAQDPTIGRSVAIKTIKVAELTDDAERGRLRERLFREAQSAGLLSHPGIVVVYDVGEQEDLTYIAMEFVNGPTLDKLLRAEEPPEPQVILNVLHQTAAALDYAHKKGIVHRDIKPANVMIDEDGSAKITDFGVAKISASHQLTQTGTVLGTPNYMSPEQVQGKPVDGRADQFSLAVVAYEMLTGEKPFQGEQLTTVLYKIVSEDPPPPQYLNPTLGFAVSMVLGRALSKDPAKRYPSCTEFVNALETALKTKKGWRALPRGASQNVPTAVVGSGVLSARPRAYLDATASGQRKRRVLWRAIAAALVAMGVVAGLFFVAQKYLLGPSEPAATAQQPAAPPVVPPKPDTGGAAQVPPKAPATAETPAPETPAPETPGSEAPAPRQVEGPERQAPPPAVKPSPARLPAELPLQITTSPAGATVVLDNDPAKTCASPCAFQVPPGSHALAVTLTSYRRELRFVDVTSAREVFIPLVQPSGTVRITSEPPGGMIVINDQARTETTPATFVLPAGTYRVVVSKGGRQAEKTIEIKDGSLASLDVQLP